MKEIGSFIELEFPKGKEFYNNKTFGKENIKRLNNARTGIFHAIKCYGVKKVYLPIYECNTVRDFLIKKGIAVKYYKIDKDFRPLIKTNENNSAIVFVNYYGVMSRKHFNFIKHFNNVIIDNAQGFFFEPIKNCMNVYSCRKFVGVPDGSYVIGKNANRFEYDKDYSSDTAAFLLMRSEYGLEGKTYTTRKLNEERIDNSDVLEMSDLTRIILDGYNYSQNIKKRKSNFKYARKLFDSINLLNINRLSDENVVPMVYPLLIDKDIINELHENKIFQGHWWEYIVEETKEEMFENKLSKYIIPITIDQRYSKHDIKYQYELIKSILEKKA